MDIVRKATIEDINLIEELYTTCIDTLHQKGIFQWDSKYPNRDTYVKSIEKNELYILENKNIIIGAVILNKYQAREWDLVNWKVVEGNILVIHALVVNILLQGRGYGREVLELCERYAIDNNYSVIRLDVFSENNIAIKLYEQNGYQKAGEVRFDFKPIGHQKYYCYEKKM